MTTCMVCGCELPISFADMVYPRCSHCAHVAQLKRLKAARRNRAKKQQELMK